MQEIQPLGDFFCHEKSLLGVKKYRATLLPHELIITKMGSEELK
jgi:hypothetical protein